VEHAGLVVLSVFGRCFCTCSRGYVCAHRGFRKSVVFLVGFFVFLCYELCVPCVAAAIGALWTACGDEEIVC
jgi:hypothetical protein